MHINEQIIWSSILNYYHKYRRFVMPVSILVGFILGVIVYAFLSRGQYQEAAQQALAETLSEYDRAYTSPETWVDIEFGGKTGYVQFSRSSLAPYFQILQVDALLYQQKLPEAIALMKEALASLSKESPLYYLYVLKYARMQIDSSDSVIQQAGQQLLQSLAFDQKNRQRDQALYYLAYFYESQKDEPKALETWQELASIKQKDVISPWVSLAQDKVNKVHRE